MIREKVLDKDEIIPLNFDYVFTGIFNNEKNIDIVEAFLSIYLDKPIKDIKGNVKIMSRDLSINSRKEKNKQVDILLDLNGEKINIELSNSMSKGNVERNIVYACKIHGDQLKYKDNNYSNIERTLQINLNNFTCNDENLIDSYYFRNNSNKVLTKRLQIDYVDLVKAKDKRYNKTRLGRLCQMLTCNSKEGLKEILGGDLMEEKAKDKLESEMDKYSEDEEVVALYSAYSREELERNTIIHEAKEAVREAKEAAKEAKHNKAIEIAKNLRDLDIELTNIIKATGLSKKEIENLK